VLVAARITLPFSVFGLLSETDAPAAFRTARSAVMVIETSQHGNAHRSTPRHDLNDEIPIHPGRNRDHQREINRPSTAIFFVTAPTVVQDTPSKWIGMVAQR
jgi:hypothetical protein